MTQLELPDKGLKIIARSLFREMAAHGYRPRQMLALVVELLDLVTAAMRSAANANAERR